LYVYQKYKKYCSTCFCEFIFAKILTLSFLSTYNIYNSYYYASQEESTMTFEPNETPNPGAIIKVIGVGGGGTNAVTSMINENISGVEFFSANTDVQSLRTALAPGKIQLGKELTKGLGAGSDPDIGREAALEDRYEIQEALSGADMVFVTAGMGGGTGTGSAAIISQIARELGALTVGVVTKPFAFEGKRRRKHSLIGIERLKEHVDTLITIPNQKLLQVVKPNISMIDAFKMADGILVNAVRGISDIINIPGTINVDFADVKTIMSSMGQALMGIGIAGGENRAIEAANQAICSPLLEDVDIEGATGILINITAGENISLLEVNEACMVIQEAAHEDANVIFGTVLDPNAGDQIQITVIATGFPNEQEDDLSASSQQANKIIEDLSGINSFHTTQKSKTNSSLISPHNNPLYHKQTPLTKSSSYPPLTKSTLTNKPITNKQPLTNHTHKKTLSANTTNTHELNSTLSAPTFKAKEPVFTSDKTFKETLQDTEQKPTQATRETSIDQGQSTPLSKTTPVSPFETNSNTTNSFTPTKQDTTEENLTTESNFYTEDRLDEQLTTENKESLSMETTKEKNDTSLDHSLDHGLDQQIDEALKLAERIKTIDCKDDDLDVPTFLRKENKEQPPSNT
jgi:cell division protein FtsZ